MEEEDQIVQAVKTGESWPSACKPSGYWRDKDNQRSFLTQLALKLKIKKPEDWYTIPVKTVVDEGGWFIQKYYSGSLILGKIYNIIANLIALKSTFPETAWTFYNRFTYGHTPDQRISKSQLYLLNKLKELFPDTTILSNYRVSHINAIPSISEKILKFYEFDVSYIHSPRQHLLRRYISPICPSLLNTKDKLITLVLTYLGVLLVDNKQT
jgi:hypothetical protein